MCGPIRPTQESVEDVLNPLLDETNAVRSPRDGEELTGVQTVSWTLYNYERDEFQEGVSERDTLVVITGADGRVSLQGYASPEGLTYAALGMLQRAGALYAMQAGLPAAVFDAEVLREIALHETREREAQRDAQDAQRQDSRPDIVVAGR